MKKNKYIFCSSAAHCLFTRGLKDRASDLLVEVGVLNRNGPTDREIYENRSTFKYLLHPNSTGVWNDLANLAIIVLHIPVIMNRAIRPICIWPTTNKLDDAISTIGYVAGLEQIDRGIHQVKYMKLSRFLISSQVNLFNQL